MAGHGRNRLAVSDAETYGRSVARAAVLAVGHDGPRAGRAFCNRASL